MEIFEIYRQYFDKIYQSSSARDRDILCLFGNMPPRNEGNPRLLRAKKHFDRVKRMQEDTDLENRLDAQNAGSLLNYDQRTDYDKRIRLLLEDPVYKTIYYGHESFDKFKKNFRIRYKNNSHKIKKIRQHRELFNHGLFEAIRKFENRLMQEEEYTFIRDDPETWLLDQYIESHEKLEEEDNQRKIRENEFRKGCEDRGYDYSKSAEYRLLHAITGKYPWE